jgi:hypothetical protein
MNGDVPLLSLDPSAHDVSYATVLHGVKFGFKAVAEQCAVAVATRRGGSRRTSPSCLNFYANKMLQIKNGPSGF